MKNRIKYWVISFITALSVNYFISVGIAADIYKPPSPPTGLKIESGQFPPPSSPSPPPGNESLLPGMTPVSYKLPSGWSLVRAQDFENGCGNDEDCGRVNGTIGLTKPHSGSKGIEGTYANDQGQVGWKLYGQTGIWSELHVSFWEYIESQARFNDEFWMYQISVHSPSFQEIILNFMYSGVYNNTQTAVVLSRQGNYSKDDHMFGSRITVPTGAWHQWEIWAKQSNPPGTANVFFRVYKDGNPYGLQYNNIVMNGVSMNSCDVMVGSQYSRVVWMYDYPTCSKCASQPGDGDSTDFCTNYKGWIGQAFSNPICGPSQDNFKRFIDDIIIMKK